MDMVKDRRLNNLNQLKALLTEQINILRNDDEISNVDRARAIGYLANIALSVYKENEVVKRLDEIEQQLNFYKGVS